MKLDLEKSLVNARAAVSMRRWKSLFRHRLSTQAKLVLSCAVRLQGNYDTRISAL